jgi:hypothetical protein
MTSEFLNPTGWPCQDWGRGQQRVRAVDRIEAKQMG